MLSIDIPVWASQFISRKGQASPVKQLRIGFLSPHNYLDRNAFSGTLYSMHWALVNLGVEVVNLGYPRRPFKSKALEKLYRKLFHDKTRLDFCASNYETRLKEFSSFLDEQLSENPCDVILAPVASSIIGNIEINLPIVYLSDTTFKLYRQLYHNSKLTSKYVEMVSDHEQRAISRADKLVYPSQWAAESAVNDYGASWNKIDIIPFGANLTAIPTTEKVLLKQASSPCRLLFLAKEWKRKGGIIAFDALMSLLSQGIDAELWVVGCVCPAEIQAHPNVKSVPFLDKNIPQQREKLKQILLASHFLIFPTRADCFGIVICEANAFGVFVVTTDVGGIPTIIRNGKNGQMLSTDSSGEDYANVVASHFVDTAHYQQLVASSRAEYDARLNWKTWAKSIYSSLVSFLE